MRRWRVYMLYNTPPFALVVKSDSPIKTPKDLEGKTIGGPANDGALKLFPAFAKIAKIDASKVTITNMAPNLREQMLMRGQIDAGFGYVTTVSFSAKAHGARSGEGPALHPLRRPRHGPVFQHRVLLARLRQGQPEGGAGLREGAEPRGEGSHREPGHAGIDYVDEARAAAQARGREGKAARHAARTT